MDGSKFDRHTLKLAGMNASSNRRTLLLGAIAAAFSSKFAWRANSTFAQGSCQAPLTECAGSCVDLSTDTYHCGYCGGACMGVPAPGQSSVGQCIDGQCQPVCLEDAAYCDGSCTDLAIDFLNCGSCGSQCSGSQVCCAGRCISETDADRFCESCGLLGGWPQDCHEDEECDGAVCVPSAVGTESEASSSEESGVGTIEQLEARIKDLEQRVIELEAAKIPIDPNAPDAGSDYFLNGRDPNYLFGMVCTIEEQMLNYGYQLICIRPQELQ